MGIKVGWWTAGALGVAVVAVIIVGAARFRRDIRAAQERLRGAGGQIIETGCGPIEYTTAGNGEPVLVVHGIFGGFDQGAVIARGNVGEGYRSIAPSRFGYLGTLLPEDASPASQADAYVCLLDALGIERAAILGTSAGATSALQFALRHPERCSALVLFSANLPGEVEAALLPKPVAQAMFRSDFLFWLLTTYFSSSMRLTMGVPEGFELTPEYEAEVAAVMATILPVRPRSAGALFDMYVSNLDINTGDYPLQEIAVPTLIVNAVDDPLTLYQNAQSATERITGARLLTITDGGHMLLGHEERIRSEIGAFLSEQVSARPEKDR